MVSIDRACWTHVRNRIRSRVGSAVAAVAAKRDCPTVVSFKRYLEPRVLSHLEARIVMGLDGEPSVRNLSERIRLVAPRRELTAALHALECARVIQRDLAQEDLIAIVSASGAPLARGDERRT
jgi:hypothetical protein